jgi:hypothetical protein
MPTEDNESAVEKLLADAQDAAEKFCEANRIITTALLELRKLGYPWRTIKSMVAEYVEDLWGPDDKTAEDDEPEPDE